MIKSEYPFLSDESAAELVRHCYNLSLYKRESLYSTIKSLIKAFKYTK